MHIIYSLYIFIVRTTSNRGWRDVGRSREREKKTIDSKMKFTRVPANTAERGSGKWTETQRFVSVRTGRAKAKRMCFESCCNQERRRRRDDSVVSRATRAELIRRRLAGRRAPFIGTRTRGPWVVSRIRFWRYACPPPPRGPISGRFAKKFLRGRANRPA